MVLIIHPEILVWQLSKQTPKPQLGARNLRALSSSMPIQRMRKKKTRIKMVRDPKRTTSRTASGTGRTPQMYPWTTKSVQISSSSPFAERKLNSMCRSQLM